MIKTQREKLCVITMDVEPDWTGYARGCPQYEGVKALRKFVSLLESIQGTCTFFVCASAAQHLLAALDDKASSYEIASHGLNHTPLTRIPPNEVGLEIKASGRIIEETFKVKPVGFRCPMGMSSRFVIKTLATLQYVYDSTFLPSIYHLSRFRNIGNDPHRFPTLPFKIRFQESSLSIIEIPISVSTRFRIPAGSYWMQLIGTRLSALLYESLFWPTPLVMYTHSWTITDIPRCEGVPILVDKVGYPNRGEKEFKLLSQFLKHLKRTGFKFVKARELAEQWNVPLNVVEADEIW